MSLVSTQDAATQNSTEEETETVLNPTVVDPFVVLGHRYAREAGFKALKPGERLPGRWYMANPSTGVSDIDINERETVG